ncbi:unnamed protein product [Schistocephalus solidus]|uniref:Prothymosin alpha n=1 Tax=Schistocephalus solidus TaxID=70667 RepID=A0A183TJ10_SCHSO|nr:unnamed protein product [Schistocephalus solidus]
MYDKPTEVDSVTTPAETAHDVDEGDAKEHLDTTPLVKALDEVKGKQGKDSLPEGNEAAKDEVTEDASQKGSEESPEQLKKDSGADVNSEPVSKEQGTDEENKEEKENKSKAKPEEV